ncbi:MAG: DUF533 domain-containing protein [Eikenella sp.]|nr:DUF533 domain-containing protein [Eikenella sp.]
MDFNKLLNQVLASVPGAGKPAGRSAAGPQDLLMKVGGAAVAGSLLSGMLKKRNTQKWVRAGSMAALGALAYHAYQNWQSQKSSAGQAPAAAALPPAAFEPGGAAAETAGRVILRTMIAAAAADGLIDDEERRLIGSEGGDDPELQQWLAAEAARPATPAEIAAEIGQNTALAAEAYLAARMVCGDLARKEIVFLSQLSHALKLDEALVDNLEQQAGF